MATVMQLFQIEGIVLHTLNFRDYDLIATVFSSEWGLVKLIAKGANRRTGRKGGIPFIPLVQAEFICRKGRGELHQCQEITLISLNTVLRRRLDLLDVSCEMLQIVRRHQPLERPSPQLYQLLIAYLKYLPEAQTPKTLAVSFRLKLLKNEGVLNIEPRCAQCSCVVDSYCVNGGQVFCADHQVLPAVCFSEEESRLLYTLVHTRSRKEIFALSVQPDFCEKVELLFLSLLA